MAKHVKADLPIGSGGALSFCQGAIMALKALKRLRTKAKMTLEELSGKTGISVSQISRYESGERDPSLTHLRALAAAFDAPIAVIAEEQREIPVIGYVGAGAEVHVFDDYVQGDGIDHIEAPPGVPPNAIAVRVRGDSMMPAYHDGDHIIYDQQLRGRDIGHHIGRECVVRLTDGRTFIKTLGRGSTDHSWTLWSYNAAPMQDVILEWAGRVRWIERA